mmetsp:Transcript_29321/g.42556  ORF Transcript_29321/g.42556 Transcript_29321/m.42556 type:complete len:131 (+) Transcript_29321:776-1168(+)
MTVVDPTQNGAVTEITNGVPSGFQALTVSVSAMDKRAYFGGLDSGNSVVLVYDISPSNPVLVDTVPVAGRITSVAAAANNTFAFVVDDGTSVEFASAMGMDPGMGDPTSSSSEVYLNYVWAFAFIVIVML